MKLYSTDNDYNTTPKTYLSLNAQVFLLVNLSKLIVESFLVQQGRRKISQG